MATELTDRQREVFNYICEVIRDESRPPTVREISDHFGFKSPKAASDHLSALERKDYIVRKSSSARNIKVRPELSPMGMPLVNRVPGEGRLLDAENIEDSLTIPELFETSERTFALATDDDSMKDAGIMKGDYVVVEKDEDVEDGQLAAVMDDGRPIVRRVSFSGNSHVTLKPENSAYEEKTLQLDDEGCGLLGPITGVLRRM